MSVHLASICTAEEFDAAVGRAASVVYLTVEWSGPERVSHASFEKAVDRWRASNPTSGTRFFIAREDDEHVLAWLRAHGHHAYPAGTGSVFLASRGQELGWVPSSRSAELDAVFDLADRTAEALHDEAEPARTDRRAKLARGVLVGVGLLFILSGSIVGGLRLAQVIPKAYGWVGLLFLVLGAVGAVTAAVGLRAGRRWPLQVLALLYVPWTIVGLVGDTKQGYWPLVAGEAVGLVVVVWALATLLRRDR